MLLHRVSLQGFLAHYGREIDGAVMPIELDFRESGLWLMHGANGSGKSSVFDAITFALFDKARGSQLAQLVNDRSESAHVEVEFETRGERYLVKRHLKLKRKRDGHQSSPARVSRWDEAENRWVEVEGVGKIREWTTKTLQVSYENFVSSVILEQGRADQFLRATPRERREQLMQLLDLSVYEKIAEVANRKRLDSRALLKAKEAQLERATPITPADVEAAQCVVTDAQTRAREAGEAVVRASETLEDARRAAAWEAQIAEKVAQQGADAAILADEASIEQAARERDELSAILPSLRALAAARRARDEAARELQSAQGELATAQTQQAELAPVVEQKRAESIEAAGALTAARLRATQAELDGARAAGDAQTLGHIEALEAELKGCENDLAPHQSWLERAERIEARRARIAELSEVLRVVKPLHQASERLERARQAADEAQIAHEKALERAGTAQSELDAASAARGELDDDEPKSERAKLAAKLELNRETLRARDELGQADECPTCGSPLDDGEAGERIAHEREMLRRELEDWQARLDEIEAQLRALERDKKARKSAEKNARQAFDEASRAANRTEAEARVAERDLAEKTAEWHAARELAGEWNPEDLAGLETRLAELEPQTIDADWRALQSARDAARQIEATARASRAQLERLPAWDADKRQAIGELQRDLASVLNKARAELNDAEAAANQAQAQQERAQTELGEASNAAKIAVALEAQRAATAQSADAELKAQRSKIAPSWSEHRAAREDAALDELGARYDELQPLAARLDELRAARGRVGALQGAIEQLRAQIEALPIEHRIVPDEAEAALNEARAALAQAENALGDAKDALVVTRQKRADFERCQSELESAQVEWERDRDLAEILGRDGLQARIIKQAQENLRSAANGVLGRLSKGQWQIDLRAQGEDDSELEIIARDEGRGGYERSFSALSGGERVSRRDFAGHRDWPNGGARRADEHAGHRRRFRRFGRRESRFDGR